MFVRNHAQSIVACDFLVVVTARFRTLYVFPLDGGRDTAHRALQRDRASNGRVDFAAASRSDPQRSFLPFPDHDRDSIFSAEVDQQLKAFGLRGLHTPARAPKANAYCEGLVGTIRRECLDFMIPLGEKHLRRILA
jgi:putative transposase